MTKSLQALALAAATALMFWIAREFIQMRDDVRQLKWQNEQYFGDWKQPKNKQ